MVNGKNQENVNQKEEGLFKQIKNQSVDPDKIGRFVKKFSVTTSLIGIFLITTFIFIFGYIFYKFFGGISTPYSLISVGIPVFFCVIMVIIPIVAFRRMSRVNVEPNLNFDANNNVAIAPNEKIVGTLVGISRAGIGNFGTEVMGVGENNYPENALLLTNHQLIAIVIPVAGADKIIGGSYISNQQWFFSKKKLVEKLQELLKTVSLDKIVKSHKHNYALSLTKLKVDIGTGMFRTLNLETENQKVHYTFNDAADYDKAKILLADYFIR